MGNRSLVLAFLISAAACGSDPMQMFPPTGDDEVPPDADPNAPDAEPPDADPTDAGVPPDAPSDDMLGPTIVPVSPAPGTLHRGEVAFIVTVTDEDGVVDDTVVATIATTHTVELTRLGTTNNFIGEFDTTVLAGLVYPPIVIRAEDVPGNASQLGYQIALDNEGPIASLDPPRVREAQVEDGILQCSTSFDPVGADAPNDGARVLQLSELRARVYDVGNTGTSTSPTFIPSAGIASVEIYVLDDTTRPLVVDYATDADDECDDINPKLVPTSVPVAANEAAVVELVSVPATGESYFPADMTSDPFTGDNLGCAAGEDAELPEQLCAVADGTRIIEDPLLKIPQIYVLPLVTEIACMGYAFDALATNIADGWACVAVRAVDNVGNVRVSAPLRVCIDSNDDGAAPCDADEPAGAPDCTGTYVPATDTVNATPCAPVTIDAPAGGGHELLRIDL